MASSIGRAAVSVSGRALISAASRGGSASVALSASSCSSAGLDAAQAQPRSSGAWTASGCRAGVPARPRTQSQAARRQQVQMQRGAGRRRRWHRAAAPTRHRPGCLRCRSRVTTNSPTWRQARPARRAARWPPTSAPGRRGARRNVRSSRWPFAAGDFEAAVRRPQRRHRDAALLQPRHPGAVGTEPRPAGTAERQHHHAGAHHTLALRRVETQAAAAPRRVAPSRTSDAACGTARPARAADAARRAAAARPSCPSGTPGPSCRRRCRCPGRRPSRATAAAPKRRSSAPISACARAVARDEAVEGFGMRQVQPALAGEQELATHRAHAVVQMHLGAACGQHLGRHQAGRAAAHHHAPAVPGSRQFRAGRHARRL